MSKYKNKWTNGYASKKEAKRAAELEALQAAGVISDLRTQVVYELAPSVVIGGRKRPPLRYVADFVYQQEKTGSKLFGIVGPIYKTIVEDCKGFRTPVYRLKRHLMKAIHNIDILET